jgi:adenosine kinase
MLVSPRKFEASRFFHDLEKKIMDVAVTGSVAFDHIMSFNGRFQDHILPDKIHQLNVSFLVDGFNKLRGGCAANIAYSCALHQLKVGIIAAVGHDISDYSEWLEDKNIDLSAMKIHDDMHTAQCFITTDRTNNQITGFYPGAMNRAAELSLKDPKIKKPRMLIISPNAPDAMKLYPGECRELGIPFFYDPGQQVIALDADSLKDGLLGAHAVIANDYEIAVIQKKLDIEKTDDLLEFSQKVIMTLGAEGARIYQRGQETVTVPVAPVTRIVDPTGCGDAFRGGFIAGDLAGLSTEVCGRLGALTAAYCIEVSGTSEYSFTQEEFSARYKKAFGDTLVSGNSQ